jgi:hypothetical protein
VHELVWQYSGEVDNAREEQKKYLDDNQDKYITNIIKLIDDLNKKYKDNTGIIYKNYLSYKINKVINLIYTMTKNGYIPQIK